MVLCYGVNTYYKHKQFQRSTAHSGKPSALPAGSTRRTATEKQGLAKQVKWGSGVGQCHSGEGREADGTVYDNLETVVSVVGTCILDMLCRAESGKERCDLMMREGSLNGPENWGHQTQQGQWGITEATLISLRRSRSC